MLNDMVGNAAVGTRKGSTLAQAVGLKYDVQQRSKSLIRGANQGGRSGLRSGR